MDGAKYIEWCTLYGASFGLDRPEDVRMLASWKGFFEDCGFTIEELQKARMLIGRAPPRWRAEHLDAVHKAVREIRTAARKAEEERQERQMESERCGICGGYGWAIVPHPSCIVDGFWTTGAMGCWYTASVACLCNRGAVIMDNARRDKQESKKPESVKVPMSLRDYEVLCPNWFDQVEAKKQRERALVSAGGFASHLDRTFGPVLREIKSKQESRQAP